MARATNRQGGTLLYLASFLGLLGLLASARAASAQALPMLPDPVDTPGLMEIADRLELSHQQRLALPPIHDDYLRRFRDLRDGEMLKFQDALIEIAMQFMPPSFSIPPRDDLEDLVDQYDRLLDRIESVDQSLFDGLSPLLTESQLMSLQRVRVLRKLEMHQVLAMEIGGEFNQGSGVLLTELLEAYELEPSARQQIDLLLGEYEAKLHNEVRNLHTVIRSGVRDILDILDELGVRQMTVMEMMQLAEDEQTMLTFRTRFDELSKPFQKAASDVSRLNLRTFRRLIPLLPGTEAEQFRQSFYRRAYREVWADPGVWRDRYRRAAELEGLSPEQNETIAQQLRTFIERDDRLMESLADLAEESRAYRTAAMLEAETPLLHQEKIDGLREQRLDLSTQAQSTLASLLGPDLAADLEGGGGKEAGDSRVAHAGGGAGGGEGGGGEAVVAAESAPEEPQPTRPSWERDDVAMPDPMTLESVREMVRTLGWDGDHQAVVEALFDDYRASFDRTLAEARSTMTAEHEASAEAGSDAGAVNWEEKVLGELQEIESRFFKDLAALAADAAQQADLHRLRNARDRETMEKAIDSMGFVRADDGEYNVDLVVIAMMHMEGQARAKTAAVLDEYQTATLPMVHDAFDIARDLNRRFRALIRVQATGGEGSEAVAEAIMKKQREATQRLARLRRELGEANQRYLLELTRALPDEQAEDLQWQYEQEAYPDMFQESRQTQMLVDAVLELPDLTSAQREQVQQIAASFQRGFFDISRRMIDLRRSQGVELERTGAPTRAAIEHEITLERLVFDRDEVQARARMHLRLVLTEVQVQMLPELAAHR